VVKIDKIQELRGHSGPIYALLEGRKAGFVLTASGDRFIAEWNLTGLNENKEAEPSKFSIQLEQPCFSTLYLEEEGFLLAGNSEGGIHVIDLSEGKEARLLKVHEKGVFAFCHIPEENMIIAGGGNGFLSAWEIGTWKLLRHFQISSSKVRSLLYTDNQVFVGSGDGFLRVFDLPWLNETHTISGHEGGIYSFAKHPDKPILISGGKDAFLRFWKTDTLERIREIPAHNFGIYSIVFAPDGKHAATASRDKTIKIWDAQTFDSPMRIERPEFSAHTHSVNTLVWLKEPNLLVSAGDDRRLNIWKITNV
jgi:WD40 repeat protein